MNMTLPSHPPSRGTRIPRISSSSTAANGPCWKVHAKRFAIYYAALILVMFLWSGSFLKFHLEMDQVDEQPVARVGRNHHRSDRKELRSKLPLWNPKQHPSAEVSLTGAYRYRNPDCKRQAKHDEGPSCRDREGRLFFPAVDLKAALPHDEASDMAHGIQRNSSYTSVTKFVLPSYPNHAVLTRGGNKNMVGVGSVTANQDRALLLEQQWSSTPQAHDFVMALLDGHGTAGHVASHYAAISLLLLLSKHLNEQGMTPQQSLTKTFLEIDETLPLDAATDAGSTAIVMLRLQNTLYVANVGDSAAFVASYDSKTRAVDIVYRTTPHKPNAPEERARIEAAGGEVVEAQGPGDSSRVIIPMGAMVMALAMSRSIGDKQGKSIGVIADPTIDALDLTALASNGDGKELFAVVASDGLVDRVPEQQVAETLAKSFFERTTVSPLEACEELIMKSSQGWISNGVPYRDDISIATTILIRAS